MDSLDLRSAYLVVVILYFFIPLATWLVLFHTRTRATRLWCGAGLMVGVSTVLFGVPVQDPWTRVPLLMCANALTLSAVYARVWALRDLASEPFSWRHAITWMLLITFGLGAISALGEMVYVQMSLLLIQMCFYAYLCYEAWRLGRVLESRSALWIPVLYIPIVVLMAVSLLNFLWHSPQVSFFSKGLLNWAMVLMGAVSSLGLHIGYVGIVIELRRRTEMRVLDEVLRGQIRMEHSQQIAHLQRQHLMGEVSAFMSHEVRQPLTAILSNAQMARHMIGQAQVKPADLDRVMNAIVQAVGRVDQLLQRVAQHVRAPARHVTEFVLADLVRDSIEIMQSMAHKRNVTLVVKALVSGVIVKADFIELSQVLLNLIRNAIDACATKPADGRVELRIQCEGPRVLLFVEDNGPGFDEQALQQAGQPFFTTKPDGLGLGLSISRELALQNGAQLAWGNTSMGACVTLSLPIRPDPLPPDDALSGDNKLFL
jgi:signal transduction histidine kinase